MLLQYFLLTCLNHIRIIVPGPMTITEAQGELTINLEYNIPYCFGLI